MMLLMVCVWRLEEIAGDQGHVHVAALTEAQPERESEQEKKRGRWREREFVKETQVLSYLFFFWQKTSPSTVE